MATQTPSQIVAALLGASWRFVRGFTGGTAVNSPGHQGWDIAAALGTPIPAFVGGKVVYAENAGGGCSGLYVGPCITLSPSAKAKASQFWATGGGKVVIIEAADGKRYSYAHLSEIAVKEGQTITSGTSIGKVGSTGDSTGPHLHFSLISAPVNGVRKWVDPASFFAGMASGDLSGFGNLITFPIGHKLTESDVNRIVDTINAAGWFQGTNIFGEVKARNAVADVLKTFIGREWSPALLAEMSAAIGVKATTVDANPLEDISSTLGKLFDPMTYVHTGALLLGLFLAFKGVQWAITGSQREEA